MTGLDTNILVRYFAQDDPTEAKRATTIIETELSERSPGFISTIVLVELVWVLHRSYQMSKAQVATILDTLLTAAELRIEHRDEAWVALRQLRDLNRDFADAFLGAIHVKHGCEFTFTFDKKAAKIDSFRKA